MIVGIEPTQQPGEPRPRARLRDSLKVCSSGHHEARRYGQSCGRQLTEVGALASNECDIGKTDLLEPANRFHDRGVLCSQIVDDHNVDQQSVSQ